MTSETAYRQAARLRSVLRGGRPPAVLRPAVVVSLGVESLHRPALGPDDDRHYYAAYVRDPDGNNVEAVCRRPE